MVVGLAVVVVGLAVVVVLCGGAVLGISVVSSPIVK